MPQHDSSRAPQLLLLLFNGSLPWLSAYMGHDDLLGTEVYLTATAELLALAAAGFERRYRGERSR
jgi:integrase/recombinase XerD